MFDQLPLAPLDPIFQLHLAYLNDSNPNKVNLGIGLYANESGQPVVLETIKDAYNRVNTDDFNYQPIQGNLGFLTKTAELIFQNPDLNTLAMQSTCGGTQALRIFADLALQEATTQQYTPTVLVAAPTWGNHLLIFKQFQQIKFNHLDESGFASYQNYLDTITSAPDNAVLLMHGGATHNPSGQNLSSQEIVALADIVNAKNIKVLIDSAYFGFGASLEDEAVLLSTLMNSFNNCAIAFSYSKNGSLYEHRTGALFIKTENKAALESQLQQMARESVSMAPGLGQDIMFDVLSNHFAEWELEVDTIREALAYKRDSLVDALGSKYEYLKGTRGMFGLLPFTPDIINELKQTYSVYMSSNGRINFAGINPTNFEYLVSAIKKSTS